MKTLIIFRLYDLSYSRNQEHGNKESLRVSLGRDNVLTYSLFGGWQDTGVGFSIGNLQLRKSLPLNPNQFKHITDLEYEIREVLKTGVGSHTVYQAEVLNDLKTKSNKEIIVAVLQDVLLEDLRYTGGDDIQIVCVEHSEEQSKADCVAELADRISTALDNNQF